MLFQHNSLEYVITIPQGWEIIPKGILQPGDQLWNDLYNENSKFLPLEADQEGYARVGKVFDESTFYCVIRKKVNTKKKIG